MDWTERKNRKKKKNNNIIEEKGNNKKESYNQLDVEDYNYLPPHPSTKFTTWR